MQFNGCFDRVKVIGNDFAGAALTCFQGIGVQDCEVAYNVMTIGNRGCMNIYDYDDQLGHNSSSGYIEVWRQVHHPNDHWNVHHNTFLVGPHEWCMWQNPSYVKDRPCILINNELAGTMYQCSDGPIIDLEYEPTAHWIHDNVMASPWANILEFHDAWSLIATHATDNMVYTYDKTVPVLVTAASDVFDPGIPTAASWASMEAWMPQLYSNNILDVDPEFKRWPEYPHAGTIPPMNGLYPPDASYDWSQWPLKLNLFSGKAAKLKKGAFKGDIWTRKGLLQGKKPNPLKGKGGPAKLDGTIKMTRDEFKKIIEGK